MNLYPFERRNALELHEAVEPTSEAIKEVKQAYNRVLARCNEAMEYLDNPGVPQAEKDKRIPIFRIEIVDVMSAYVKLLQDWGVKITDDEILGGMQTE